jgi:hypothetical protein
MIASVQRFASVLSADQKMVALGSRLPHEAEEHAGWLEGCRWLLPARAQHSQRCRQDCSDRDEQAAFDKPAEAKVQSPLHHERKGDNTNQQDVST